MCPMCMPHMPCMSLGRRLFYQLASGAYGQLEVQLGEYLRCTGEMKREMNKNKTSTLNWNAKSKPMCCQRYRDNVVFVSFTISILAFASCLSLTTGLVETLGYVSSC